MNLPSQSVEEYMEAIYRIGGEDGTVNTCDLASQLKVAPASVTTMLRRLSRDGLVEYARYRGITLTAHGREVAASMLRRHRLSERLLTDIIGIPWHRVHDPACKLEHVITGEIEENVYRILGEPDRCPHGHLLEGTDDGTLFVLSNAKPGESLVVVKLEEDDGELLELAAGFGITPSAQLSVELIADKSLAVKVNGKCCTVTFSLASRVWVRPLNL